MSLAGETHHCAKKGDEWKGQHELASERSIKQLAGRWVKRILPDKSHTAFASNASHNVLKALSVRRRASLLALGTEATTLARFVLPTEHEGPVCGAEESPLYHTPVV
jgi:hypothetical protein